MLYNISNNIYNKSKSSRPNWITCFFFINYSLHYLFSINTQVEFISLQNQLEAYLILVKFIYNFNLNVQLLHYFYLPHLIFNLYNFHLINCDYSKINHASKSHNKFTGIMTSTHVSQIKEIVGLWLE